MWQKLSLFTAVAATALACASSNGNTATVQKITIMEQNDSLPKQNDTAKVVKSEEEWKKILDPEVFRVARLKGTERPWTSPLENLKDTGTFYCKVCANPLFVSDTKFESGCGWPSFYQPISKKSMLYEVDNSHGMTRTEVMCGKCSSHLGHVFDDGPPPTGLRYCINGVVLDFKKAGQKEK
jgi:peptide-methionine (R)-S-oxide reductase